MRFNDFVTTFQFLLHEQFRNLMHTDMEAYIYETLIDRNALYIAWSNNLSPQRLFRKQMNDTRLPVCFSY